MIETEFSISAQHPSLQGHFPGNPIVPGVVILDEVLRCIKQQFPDNRYTAIPSVKFSAPLLPGVTVKLSVEKKQALLLSFTCRANDQVICSGQLRLSAPG